MSTDAIFRVTAGSVMDGIEQHHLCLTVDIGIVGVDPSQGHHELKYRMGARRAGKDIFQ